MHAEQGITGEALQQAVGEHRLAEGHRHRQLARAGVGIGEQQVKTGGFGAEYGRALGGVINIVTKRGSNDWKFNVSSVWTPSALTAHGKNVVSRVQAEPGSREYYSAYRSDDESEFNALLLISS